MKVRYSSKNVSQVYTYVLLFFIVFILYLDLVIFGYWAPRDDQKLRIEKCDLEGKYPKMTRLLEQKFPKFRVKLKLEITKRKLRGHGVLHSSVAGDSNR